MYRKQYAPTILALSLMFILSGCFWNNDKKDDAVEKDPVYSQQDTSLNVIDKDNSNQETKEKANKGTENNPTEAKDKNKDIVKKPDILSNENPTKITSNDNTSQIKEEEKNDNTSQTQEEEKTKSEDVVTETVIKVKPSETNRESKKENNVKNKVDKKEKIVVTKPDKKSENKDKKNKEIKTTKPSKNGKSEKEKPIENKKPDVVKPNKPDKTKPENKEPEIIKIKINKTVLEKTIKKAESLQLNLYNSLDVDLLKEELNKANSVNADTNATQEEVDMAANKLDTVIKGMRLKPVTNKKDVTKAYFDDFDKTLYNGSFDRMNLGDNSYDNFIDAYKNSTPKQRYQYAQDQNYRLIAIYDVYGKLFVNYRVSNAGGQHTVNAFNTEKIFNENLYTQEITKLVNKERTRLGLKPLTINYNLKQGADTRSMEQAEVIGIRSNGLSHTRPDGTKHYTAFNYLYGKDSKYSVGENIAANYRTSNPYQVMSEKYLAELFYNQWKNSSGHYENMISPMYSSIYVSVKMTDHYENKRAKTPDYISTMSLEVKR